MATVCCLLLPAWFLHASKGGACEVRRETLPQIKFAGMMQYDGELKLPKDYLVPPPKISHTTGEYLAKNGVRTFACSESQKIGHVTFFW